MTPWTWVSLHFPDKSDAWIVERHVCTTWTLCDVLLKIKPPMTSRKNLEGLSLSLLKCCWCLKFMLSGWKGISWALKKPEGGCILKVYLRWMRSLHLKINKCKQFYAIIKNWRDHRLAIWFWLPHLFCLI